MAISFVGCGDSSDANATLTYAPVGTKAGDLLVAVINCARVPAGWTGVFDDGALLTVAVRPWQPGDDGASFQFSSTRAAIAAFRGCDTSNPVDVVGATSSLPNPATGSFDFPAAPSITTTRSGDLILHATAAEAYCGGGVQTSLACNATGTGPCPNAAIADANGLDADAGVDAFVVGLNWGIQASAGATAASGSGGSVRLEAGGTDPWWQQKSLLFAIRASPFTGTPVSIWWR